MGLGSFEYTEQAVKKFPPLGHFGIVKSKYRLDAEEGEKRVCHTGRDYTRGIIPVSGP